MLTYEKAKEKALSLNNNIDACREVEKGYHFYKKDNNADGDFGVVIIKENGKAIQWTTFILDFHPERDPKEIEFKQEKLKKDLATAW